MTPSLRVLAVGPLPPPYDGTSVSFSLVAEALGARSDLSVRVVDSSPRRLKDEATRRLSPAGLAQGVRIVFPFLRGSLTCDRVLIFGSNGFLLRMAPLLVGWARLVGRPVHIRVFGGSLDRFIEQLAPLRRRILLGTLGRAAGVSVQTRLLYDRLRPLIGDRLHLACGYRRVTDDTPARDAGEGGRLRLVYIGHVREEKGVGLLLDGLASLSAREQQDVHCDIYGPVYEAFRDRLKAGLSHGDRVTYRGVLSADRVVPTLRDYDALVFPSTYPGEGHPGVLIEAMMAGIPVIATRFRSIPELIEDDVNGLLVDPGRAESIAAAIRRLLGDRELRARLGQANLQRRLRHDARRVIPAMLAEMGLGSAFEPTRPVEQCEADG